MFRKTLLAGAALMLVLGPAAGCQDASEPTSPLTRAPLVARADRSQVVPSPLATAMAGEKSVTFWAYTGEGFSGTAIDPISFVFPGADPRQIRSILLSVNGDRTAFQMPPVYPFNCTWKDASGGGNQTAYSNESGWVGSSIQLVCGEYGLRYHIRLFKAGDFVLGAAHFEVNITGTWEHQPLNWVAAQQFVAVDLLRSGMVNPAITPVPTGSEVPAFREINPLVWAGLSGSPLAGYVDPVINGSSIGIRNNGVALKVAVLSAPPTTPLDQTEEFDVNVDQTVPQPFCNPDNDLYVHVKGTLHVTRHTVVDEALGYHNRQEMKGELEGVPANGPLAGQSFRAMVDDVNTGVYSDHQDAVSLYTRLQSMPSGLGSSVKTLSVGPGNSSNFNYTERCD